MICGVISAPTVLPDGAPAASTHSAAPGSVVPVAAVTETLATRPCRLSSGTSPGKGQGRLAPWTVPIQPHLVVRRRLAGVSTYRPSAPL